jgi:hypothetical protein
MDAFGGIFIAVAAGSFFGFKLWALRRVNVPATSWIIHLGPSGALVLLGLGAAMASIASTAAAILGGLGFVVLFSTMGLILFRFIRGIPGFVRSVRRGFKPEAWRSSTK